MTLDALIIGAGPAGLAAAARLQHAGASFALVDEGYTVRARDRYDPQHLTRGQGGAGLFSDGKFSFYPSASELWTLPGADSLRSAYDWTTNLLSAYGLDVPPFPDSPTAFSFGDGE